MNIYPTVVHINDTLDRGYLPHEFYRQCGIEAIGPYADMRVREIIGFTNFDQLLDNLRKKSAKTRHLIVTHGTDSDGMLIRLTRNSSHNATGKIIGDVSDLADDLAKLNQKKLSDMARSMAMSRLNSVNRLKNKLGATSFNGALGLAEKLIALRRTRLDISIRGCNLGKNHQMLLKYKKAFNALRLMAPKCRNFFLKIGPDGRQNSLPHLEQLCRGQAAVPAGAQAARRRCFPANLLPAPQQNAGPIVIDVIDHDGHSNVEAETYVHDPNRLIAWARRLDGAYKSAQTHFVLEVMWPDTGSTYHYPRELEYSRQIAVV